MWRTLPSFVPPIACPTLVSDHRRTHPAYTIMTTYSYIEMETHWDMTKVMTLPVCCNASSPAIAVLASNFCRTSSNSALTKPTGQSHPGRQLRRDPIRPRSNLRCRSPGLPRLHLTRTSCRLRLPAQSQRSRAGVGVQRERVRAASRRPVCRWLLDVRSQLARPPSGFCPALTV